MKNVKVVNQEHGKDWSLYQGDSNEVLRGLPDNSVHYNFFSPPFQSLFVFSDSPRDMSNNSNEQFWQHMQFLATEQYRTTMPGRLLSFHCCNLPFTKGRDGYIGIQDFRGDMIRLYQEAGWIFHAEVVIWKDPIVAMQRTKAIGLLHKQVVKDSAMSRMGIPDYVITMRKPGDNPEPIAGMLFDYVGDNPEFEKYAYKSPDFMQYFQKLLTSKFKLGSKEMSRSIDIWSQYASPVWMDIRAGDTLQKVNAKENGDERHITPTQLDVVRRCLQLYSMPGDIVVDPFNGIGSTGYVAIEQGRKYIGIELKGSYFNCSKGNLRNAVDSRQGQLAFA
jgi:DNA modification methylase